MISPRTAYARSSAAGSILPRLSGSLRLARRALLVLMAILWIVPTPCRCETDISAEYQVKAAYLGKFLKYIDWQGDVAGKSQGELVIGIMGDTPLAEAAAVLAGKQVKFDTVRVRRVANLEEIRGCRLLFVGLSEKRRMGQILAAAGRNHVLTVSDIKRFVHAGGGIGFVSRGKTIRFEINNKSARSAGAHISSDLLRLAESVVD